MYTRLKVKCHFWFRLPLPFVIASCTQGQSPLNLILVFLCFPYYFGFCLMVFTCIFWFIWRLLHSLNLNATKINEFHKLYILVCLLHTVHLIKRLKTTIILCFSEQYHLYTSKTLQTIVN